MSHYDAHSSQAEARSPPRASEFDLLRRFPHNAEMDDETSPPQRPKTFWSWATTPPQSYAVYLVCLILVFLLSFYAGTLKPKKVEGPGPPLSLAPPR